MLTGISGYADDPKDVPPPQVSARAPTPGDVPIDENISILALAAIIFGIYIIYNYKLNKKRPI
ncbi:hypothetical protein [Flavobacterium granuli]|uniref:PEP-CTERM protein-sorting domain-containing protein n=1 Tax=Flavobacterium granuli TaxID=280093 RepID=A0ABU1S2G3_9FLAO|nr:hypothetical protein [Flavobacterium granuli]MDR6844845.1 hypothetical protein [Flavobacterium granuli]